MKKKDEMGEITTRFEFLLYTEVIKALWDQHRERHRDQWNGMGSPEIEPHNHRQPIPDRVQKQVSGGRTVFSTKGAEATGHPRQGK